VAGQEGKYLARYLRVQCNKKPRKNVHDLYCTKHMVVLVLDPTSLQNDSASRCDYFAASSRVGGGGTAVPFTTATSATVVVPLGFVVLWYVTSCVSGGGVGGRFG